MPLQNRVTPFGEIEALPARGAWMGNRGGCLHDRQRRLGAARWRSRRWIVCALNFKGRHRTVMSPGRYTELFFADEATALAAGHRPCAECRREAYRRFVAAITKGMAAAGLPPPDSADTLDQLLHESRLEGRRQRRQIRRLDRLPSGAMIELPGQPGTAWLVHASALLEWRPDGYGERRQRPSAIDVVVLTPSVSLGALEAGYAPALHPSSAPVSRAER
jgi:hypothetical protein